MLHGINKMQYAIYIHHISQPWYAGELVIVTNHRATEFVSQLNKERSAHWYEQLFTLNEEQKASLILAVPIPD